MDDCQLIGPWRVTAADLWEQNNIDLCGPATLVSGADGHGNIARLASSRGALASRHGGAG
jgi:hypothetical protein